MTHVSRKKLPDKILHQILDSFLFVLADTKNKEQMAQFLGAFLSNTEKVMLAKRLAIVYLLNEGVEESRVAEILNVTRPTVARIHLWYETKGKGYQIAIIKLRKQKLLNTLKILALKATDRIIRGAIGHT